MLDDDKRARMHEPGTKNQPRYLLEARMIIGGIGKHYIVTPDGPDYKFEYITLDYPEISVAEFLLD